MAPAPKRERTATAGGGSSSAHPVNLDNMDDPIFAVSNPGTEKRMKNPIPRFEDGAWKSAPSASTLQNGSRTVPAHAAPAPVPPTAAQKRELGASSQATGNAVENGAANARTRGDVRHTSANAAGTAPSSASLQRDASDLRLRTQMPPQLPKPPAAREAADAARSRIVSSSVIAAAAAAAASVQRPAQAGVAVKAAPPAAVAGSNGRLQRNVGKKAAAASAAAAPATASSPPNTKPAPVLAAAAPAPVQQKQGLPVKWDAPGSVPGPVAAGSASSAPMPATATASSAVAVSDGGRQSLLVPQDAKTSCKRSNSRGRDTCQSEETAQLDALTRAASSASQQAASEQNLQAVKTNGTSSSHPQQVASAPSPTSAAAMPVVATIQGLPSGVSPMQGTGVDTSQPATQAAPTSSAAVVPTTSAPASHPHADLEQPNAASSLPCQPWWNGLEWVAAGLAAGKQELLSHADASVPADSALAVAAEPRAPAAAKAMHVRQSERLVQGAAVDVLFAPPVAVDILPPQPVMQPSAHVAKDLQSAVAAEQRLPVQHPQPVATTAAADVAVPVGVEHATAPAAAAPPTMAGRDEQDDAWAAEVLRLPNSQKAGLSKEDIAVWPQAIAGAISTTASAIATAIQAGTQQHAPALLPGEPVAKASAVPAAAMTKTHGASTSSSHIVPGLPVAVAVATAETLVAVTTAEASDAAATPAERLPEKLDAHVPEAPSAPASATLRAGSSEALLYVRGVVATDQAVVAVSTAATAADDVTTTAPGPQLVPMGVEAQDTAPAVLADVAGAGATATVPDRAEVAGVEAGRFTSLNAERTRGESGAKCLRAAKTMHRPSYSLLKLAERSRSTSTAQSADLPGVTGNAPAANAATTQGDAPGPSAISAKRKGSQDVQLFNDEEKAAQLQSAFSGRVTRSARGGGSTLTAATVEPTPAPGMSTGSAHAARVAKRSAATDGEVSSGAKRARHAPAGPELPPAKAQTAVVTAAQASWKALVDHQGAVADASGVAAGAVTSSQPTMAAPRGRRNASKKTERGGGETATFVAVLDMPAAAAATKRQLPAAAVQASDVPVAAVSAQALAAPGPAMQQQPLSAFASAGGSTSTAVPIAAAPVVTAAPKGASHAQHPVFGGAAQVALSTALGTDYEAALQSRLTNYFVQQAARNGASSVSRSSFFETQSALLQILQQAAGEADGKLAAQAGTAGNHERVGQHLGLHQSSRHRAVVPPTQQGQPLALPPPPGWPPASADAPPAQLQVSLALPRQATSSPLLKVRLQRQKLVVAPQQQHASTAVGQKRSRQAAGGAGSDHMPLLLTAGDGPANNNADQQYDRPRRQSAVVAGARVREASMHEDDEDMEESDDREQDQALDDASSADEDDEPLVALVTGPPRRGRPPTNGRVRKVTKAANGTPTRAPAKRAAAPAAAALATARLEGNVEMGDADGTVALVNHQVSDTSPDASQAPKKPPAKRAYKRKAATQAAADDEEDEELSGTAAGAPAKARGRAAAGSSKAAGGSRKRAKKDGAGPSISQAPATARFRYNHKSKPNCTDEEAAEILEKLSKTSDEELIGLAHKLPFYTEDGGLYQPPTGTVIASNMLTVKVKLFDSNRDQVTKSCHCCQYQHVYNTCRQPTCNKSYCQRCIDRHYDGWDLARVVRKCPSCSHSCNCKPCLRQTSGEKAPQYTTEERQMFAEFCLRHTGPLTADFLAKEEAEARRWDMQGAQPTCLEDVKSDSMMNERVQCNRCCTSIPNLHRHCAKCEWDVCVRCCDQLASAEGGLTCCPNPACKEPGCPPTQQFFDHQRLGVLRKVAEEFGKPGLQRPWSLSPQCPAPPAAPACIGASGSSSLSGDSQQVRYGPPGEAPGSGSGQQVDGAANSQPQAPAPAVPPMPTATAAAGTSSSSAGPSSGAATAAAAPPVSSGAHVMFHGRSLPAEDVRLASRRGSDGEQDYLFTPHSSALHRNDPRFAVYSQIFQECWARREPIIVRGAKGQVDWTPMTMMRAVREKGSMRFNTEAAEKDLEVLNCADGFQFMAKNMTQEKFFALYEKGGFDYLLEEKGQKLMLKVKDWPPEEDFKARLVRHNQDFIDMLPCQMYTHPYDAPLNMATQMPSFTNPTDLGPKTYIAFGTKKEHAGVEYDSATKLHQDMSDAVNVLVHCYMAQGEEAAMHVRCGDEPRPDASSGYGNAGAVWDIWRAGSDTKVLREYLNRHVGEFKHHDKLLTPEDVGDAVFDHAFFLCTQQHARLKEETEVESWHFEQHQHEAVFIPAGCPHQVRNLRSCIKVAVDFVSPEALQECMNMNEQLRQCRHSGEEVSSDPYQDKLQGWTIALAAAVESYCTLHPEIPVPEGGRGLRKSTPTATAAATTNGKGGRAAGGAGKPRARGKISGGVTKRRKGDKE